MPRNNTGDATDLLTIHEVAQALGVDDTTVHKWIRDGILEAITLPHLPGQRKNYRIRRSTLCAILRTSTQRKER